MILSSEDRQFVRTKLMPFFNIKALNIDYSPSKRKWPDIEVELGKVPTITVTDEWRRQSAMERRKRLVHEALHCVGLQHGRYGEYLYSTYPARDTYSRAVYRDIIKDGR